MGSWFWKANKYFLEPSLALFCLLFFFLVSVPTPRAPLSVVHLLLRSLGVHGRGHGGIGPFYRHDCCPGSAHGQQAHEGIVCVHMCVTPSPDLPLFFPSVSCLLGPGDLVNCPSSPCIARVVALDPNVNALLLVYGAENAITL